MRTLHYPPHITFAMYDTPDVTEELVTVVMRRVAEDRTATEIGFDRVRHFPGSRWCCGPIRNPSEHCLKCTARFTHASIRRSAGRTTGPETGPRIARLRRASLP